MKSTLMKFENLESFLENWVNINDEGSYDFIGIINLFTAILRNIKKNALKSDFEDLYELISEEELEMLEIIMNHLNKNGESRNV